MTLNIKTATLAFVLLSAILLGVYIANNLIKVTWSAKKLGVITHSNPVKKLAIWQGENLVTSFSLPTSDLFDRTGIRQINFKYMTQNRLDDLTARLAKGRIQVDGETVKVALTRYPNALSLTLPDKKLFLVAPPHMPTVARVLQRERSQQSDIFLCQGNKVFCNTVSLTNFAGLTKQTEAMIKEDSFFNSVVSPSGRWIGKNMTLEFSAKRAQRIVITLHIATPFDNQKVLLQGETKPKYRLVRKQSSRFLKPLQLSVLLPLNKGKNRVKILFSQLLKASITLPYNTAGVLTKLEYTVY